jgi:hypothetical protein
MAAGLDAAGADAGLGIGQVGQQALAVLQKGAALMREADAPRGAHQQLDAQPLSSSASSRRPMMAGATPSALAAAVRLPRVATDTNDSSALSLSMPQIMRIEVKNQVGI